MALWNPIDRRRMLRAMACGACGVSVSGWLPSLAHAIAADPKRRRHCILLWMAGGPSQTDTFDMKPGHENGGEFKEIATKAAGVRFSEHLPRLAEHADKLAIIRSLTTKEGDHERGSYLMRTGQRPMGVVNYPSLASGLAKEMALADDSLPPYVSISPSRGPGQGGFGPGFLGPKFAPLVVAGNQMATPAGANANEAAKAAFAELKVDAVKPPASVTTVQTERRLELWKMLETRFLNQHPGSSPAAHQTVYNNALQMVESDASAAFDLSTEPEKVREKYGKGVFGQGCLMARRLVERGVPFVEVSLSSSVAGTYGWDTHANNFEAVKGLSAELDAGWASLMSDLEARGLLELTTIVWMGEFGRTPQINGAAGRDHFPRAWSCVLGGGGIAGGQAYGRTTADGMNIEEDPVEVTDVLATLCAALGVDPQTENTSNTGRPIKLVDGAPIDKLLA
ncbi:MAG: DUF1501 domain-containing protein [Pirellulales bacterium]